MSIKRSNANNSQAKQWLSKLDCFIRNLPTGKTLETHFKAKNDRKAGKPFTIKDHIRAMIHSMLSSQQRWKSITEVINDSSKPLERVFEGYSSEALKNKDATQLSEELSAVGCRFRFDSLEKGHLPNAEAISDNIKKLQNIKKVFGSLDKFVMSDTPETIARKLSDSKSDYKLKRIGLALACEYLKNVGIDCAKPDVHLRRFLSAKRMGIGKANNKGLTSEQSVLEQIRNLSRKTGIPPIEIDALIWRFCADGYGEMCGVIPKCDKCPIKSYCNYPRKHP